MKSIDEQLRDSLSLVVFLTNNLINVRELCFLIYEESINTSNLERMLPYLKLSLEKTLNEEKQIYNKLKDIKKSFVVKNGDETIKIKIKLIHTELHEKLMKSKTKMKIIITY